VTLSQPPVWVLAPDDVISELARPAPLMCWVAQSGAAAGTQEQQVSPRRRDGRWACPPRGGVPSRALEGKKVTGLKALPVNDEVRIGMVS